jgi:hypothetical protein
MPVQTGLRIQHIPAGTALDAALGQIGRDEPGAMQPRQIQIGQCDRPAAAAIQFQTGKLATQAQKIQQLSVFEDIPDQPAVFQIVSCQSGFIVLEIAGNFLDAVIGVVDFFTAPE